ncbi:leader peptidase (prepilin peptidase)/N-methyltransferase [Microbacteriaceae bacterium SG_E_30_P1]|uniref:Leader peptidase (Prepilin peptidase)/N-methyltransferase n=1 Tax=Antiquaquibacter oligotrophicus TaxID=2880260 RepID=A0ABT6KML1_9MICO|nr:A24 family peptidase [Antiquaquibacter oligotrophicus]MDH6180342.1 leader peptidase (prepilin peptidase)/N-methyltransferase [Antiquaquibacter oligotrophicus]UDF13915.1 A24 family peptidase [Antiquaquibacter oligotrophicus]
MHAAFGTPASRDLPIVALLLTVAFAGFGDSPLVALAACLAIVTPRLYRHDVLEHRLPNRLIVPGYPLAIASLFAAALPRGEVPWVALGAGGVMFTLFLVLALAGGMGMGDVKLAGLLGLSAGALGAEAAIASVGVAFFLGGLQAVAARRHRERSIPFGPSLLAGYWTTVTAAAAWA